jgi:putative acetyltransferase
MVEEEPFEATDSQALLRQLDAYLNSVYPPENNFLHVPADDLVAERGTFVVARDEGQPVGCGAVRVISDSTAEIKRMFVAPAARRRGVAAQILSVLEAWALAAGMSRLVLETGDNETAAIRLYEQAGFRRVACFGEYAASAQSVCYAKSLVGLQ